MTDYRWTVRLGDDGDCINLLREIAEWSGLRYGVLLELALTDWYDHLPIDDDEEDMSFETLPPSDSGTSQKAL